MAAKKAVRRPSARPAASGPRPPRSNAPEPPRTPDPFGKTLTLRVATMSEAFLAQPGERQRLGMPVGNDDPAPGIP